MCMPSPALPKPVRMLRSAGTLSVKSLRARAYSHQCHPQASCKPTPLCLHEHPLGSPWALPGVIGDPDHSLLVPNLRDPASTMHTSQRTRPNGWVLVGPLSGLMSPAHTMHADRGPRSGHKVLFQCKMSSYVF